MNEAQIKAVFNAPIKSVKLLTKVYIGTASPRQAIKAKCQECMGFHNAPAEIRNCTSPTCPLFAYRPYTDGQTDEGEA